MVGVDDNLHPALFGAPWSAPLRLAVRSDFRRSEGRITMSRTKHPRVRLTAECPEAAAGGTGKIALRRLAGGKGVSAVLRAAGTFKARFDAKGHATVTLRRPRAGYYLGTVSFSGTRFYTKSVDPNPALLRVSDERRLSYVSPFAFPQC